MNITCKTNILRLIESKKIQGVMNDTRWNATIDLLRSSEHHFEYQSMTVDGELYPEEKDASFGVGTRFEVLEVLPEHFSAIWWLDVYTRNYIHIGDLVPPKFVNNSVLALPYLSKARFKVTDYGVRIFGYVDIEEDIKFN